VLAGLQEGEWRLSAPALIDLMQSTLAKGVSFRFRAKGSSMHPFIRDDDMITVSSLNVDGPGLGDVVAFVQEGRLVVHRVIKINANGYLIKGDAIGCGDGPVPLANVLGSVTRVERARRRIFIGMGPERFIIAMLSRKSLVNPLVQFAAKLLSPITTLKAVSPFSPRRRS
jgi:hypothetical protein